MMKKVIKICSGRSLWRWPLVIAAMLAFSMPAMAIGGTPDNGKKASKQTVAKKAKKATRKGAAAEMKSFNNRVVPRKVGTSKKADNTVYDVAPTQPQYPGGAQAMGKYIADNIKYPADAKQQGKDGFVVIQFIVEKDGSMSDVKVIKNGKHPSLDAEALRVIKTLRKFTPGRNEKGQPVRVKYTVPVHFKL